MEVLAEHSPCLTQWKTGKSRVSAVVAKSLEKRGWALSEAGAFTITEVGKKALLVERDRRRCIDNRHSTC